MAATPKQGPDIGPALIVAQGMGQRVVPITRLPFTIGRKSDRDLILSDPRISREHAELTAENGDLYLLDLGSRHGTYVNGQRASRQRLKHNDRLQFGALDGASAMVRLEETAGHGVREFLSQISDVEAAGSDDATSDLEKLKIFLQAARKFNATGVLDEVLATLLEATLRLTHADRAYVLLRQPDGSLSLAAGRSAAGAVLLDDSTISHSIIADAMTSASGYVITDTSKFADLSGRNSIVLNNLRTVICIPFRPPQVQQTANGAVTDPQPQSSGVLYLDSQFTSGLVSAISQDILHTIAREAASLVEHAHMAQAEAAARRYRQELAIAASIQQRLMSVSIPELAFASVRGRNLPCLDIGGDFFDVIHNDNGLAIVICDVSGKGVSAALLGSILQGMIYSQLGSSLLLSEIAASVNQFLCRKVHGEKYATLVIARLTPDGALEYLNCGHVSPLVVSGQVVERVTETNLPVGLLPSASYRCATRQLQAGDRVIVMTDGLTEAENEKGEMFESSRVEEAALKSSFLDSIIDEVRAFSGSEFLADDCTILELTYLAPATS